MNTQSVNAILQPSTTQPLKKDKSFNVLISKAIIKERDSKLVNESINDIKVDDQPLNDKAKEHIKKRSIETAKNDLIVSINRRRLC